MENPGWDTNQAENIGGTEKKIPILIPAPRFYIVTLCVEAPPWWHRTGSGCCPRREMGSSGSAFPRGAPAVPRMSPLPSRDLSCSTFGMFGSAGWGQSRSSLQPEQLRRGQLRATFLLGFFLLLFSFFFFFHSACDAKRLETTISTRSRSQARRGAPGKTEGAPGCPAEPVRGHGAKGFSASSWGGGRSMPGFSAESAIPRTPPLLPVGRQSSSSL